MHLESYNNRTRQFFVINPPSTPLSLVVTGTTSSTISLSWNASSPGTYSIAGYEVFRNGAYVTTVAAGTTYTDTGLSASTSYNYNVEAIDVQGNTSAQSNTASGTTGSSGGAVQINTTMLSSIAVGSSYSQAISVSGGSGSGYSVYIQQAVPNSLIWLQMTGPLTLGGIPQAVELVSVTLVACDGAGNVSAPVTLTIQTTVSGALGFVTGTTLPATTSGGPCAQQVICEGGQPPYIHASPNQAGPWAFNWDGFLLGAPTTTGAVSYIDMVTDSAGTTISQTVTTTVGTGIMLSNLDSTTNQINLPKGTAGQNYLYNFAAFGGSGGGYSCSVTSGSLAPGLSLSGLQITGTPSRAGTFFATVQVTDGTHTQSYTVCQQVLAADTASRPSYNTGTGFFVVNGKLYDPSGKRFTIRGLDRNHYDGASWAGGANGGLTGTNSVRVFGIAGQTASYITTECNAQYLPGSGNYIFPIINCSGASGTGSSGNTSPTLLSEMLNVWLGISSGISSLDSHVCYNIANEWGASYSSSTTAWLYSYQYVAGTITNVSGATVTVNTVSGTNPFANCTVALIQNAGGITPVVLIVQSTGGVSGAWTVTFTASPTGTYTSGGTLYGGAVGCMRGMGFLGPIVIDAGGNGQDWNGIIQNAAAIQNSDPQQNCIFAYHGYSTAENYECTIASATKANPCVLTLNCNLPYHPLNYNQGLFNTGNGHPGNGTISATGLNISGALGMTQLNGLQAIGGGNNCGGSQGAWTVTTGVNSTSWGTYTGGGRLTVSPFDYRQIYGALAALQSNNVCVAILEFGPGNQMGAGCVALQGYIDNGSGSAGTQLTVTSMLTPGAILPQSVTKIAGGRVYMQITGNSSPNGTLAGTTPISQSGGTTGLAGTYLASPVNCLGQSTTPGVMDVTAVYTGSFQVGDTIVGTGIPPGTTITSLAGSGNGPGNYGISTSTLFSSTPVYVAQLVGSSASPVTMFVQSIYGSNTSWYGPPTGISPGNTSIGQTISACEANGLHWNYWAFDDHDEPAVNQGTSWFGWFGMCNVNLSFAVPSDLNPAGMDMVYNPRYGLRTLAQPPSSYV